MKRLILIALLSFIVPALFAQTDVDFYKAQFNNAGTLIERLAVVKTVVNQNVSGADSFYADALNSLLSGYPNVRTTQDHQAANEMAILLVQSLGKNQYTDAAPNVWKTVKTFSDAMVKSEALISLGQMGATDLLPNVAQTLVDTNTQGPVNRTSGERIAYGAITALASFKDTSGYAPVFFAANGWYRNWVRKTANDALSQIAEDPAEPLISIIQDPSYSYEQKLLALSTIEKSSSSDDNKGKAAAYALAFGWRGSSSSAQRQEKIVQIRKNALVMLSKYGSGGVSVQGAADDSSEEATLEFSVEYYLNRSYRYSADTEEQLYTIDAFAKIASDSAVSYMGTYTTELNDRKIRRSLSHTDERRIRALIHALGATKNQNAKPHLQAILQVNWTEYILQQAQQTMDNL